VNYSIVGAFVLVLGSALIAGVLWLASGGAFQKKYELYAAIEDESVAGLNLNAPVKYNGVDVGKVQDIELDAFNPQRVNLLFAIEHGTPIKEDTIAVLKTQGLTGITYVELGGGTQNSPLLRAVSGSPYPLIRTKPSLSARLENILTSVLVKLDGTSSNINEMLSDQNRTAFKSILADMATVARTVAARKDAIDEGIRHAAKTAKNAAAASAQIGPVIEKIGRSADAVEQIGMVAGADLKQFSTETLPELERLLGELSALTTSLRRLSEQTGRDPQGLLFGRKQVPPGPGEATTGATKP
jgi:phospholipid/cholesterol/gamma-HCH transport system substrate-binding protein